MSEKKNKSVKIESKHLQQPMLDAISETFAKLGCSSIQFGAKGKTFIDTKKKQLRKKI
jgi:hypothetical protein